MDESCTLTIRRTESGYVFHLRGRGTLRESVAFRDFVSAALAESVEVVIDLSDCDYLDSTFLGCLLILHQRAVDGVGSLAFVADAIVRKRLLAALRLDRVLAFATSVPLPTGPAAALDVSSCDDPGFCAHLVEAHQKLAELGGPAAEAFREIAKQMARELQE